MAQKRTKTKPRRAVKTVCYFCEQKTEPDYFNTAELVQFISDRAKIIRNDYSGLCSKHQRRVSIAIKRARHLALLPFRPQLV